MNRNDPRMLQLPRNLRFFDESPDQMVVFAVLLEQDLDRKVAAENRIASPEYGPHPASRDLTQEPHRRRPIGRCGCLRREGPH
jgi:hypothetical protein